MSHPPTGVIAPAVAPEGPAGAGARPSPPAASAPAAPPGAPGPRRPAWREALARARAAAVTEPGRLRVIGALLAVLLLAFGALTTWQVSARKDAASAVAHRSQSLSKDAADLYSSLASANAAVTQGFLTDGPEPKATRADYTAHIEDASRLLSEVTAAGGTTATSREQLDRLHQFLPTYTSLVESARANNRFGYPLGGAYLRYANEVMQDELLAAAKLLYEAQSEQLEADYADAKAWPWAALALGVLAVAALVWAQRRSYQRTNRIFNLGLLGATVASVAVLGWLVLGHAVARSALSTSDREGAQSLRLLNQARIAVLQARTDENLTLVARGAQEVAPQEGAETDAAPAEGDGNDADATDAYETEYRERMKELKGAARSGATPQSLLGRAEARADDEAGRDPVRTAIAKVNEWQGRHTTSRAEDHRGAYDRAVQRVIAGPDSTTKSYTDVDEALGKAIEHEAAEFGSAVDDGDGFVAYLPGGAAALALLGAAGAVTGVGRRLSEYR
ncbi:hypothetical protein ACMA1D_26450 [Streptomyces sp. 796.1]|uniref:hypothetical protein n=1 Tax=Streptomyces sp. 796.1 TaxID=3163029 RepID=UPI0039C9D0C4